MIKSRLDERTKREGYLVGRAYAQALAALPAGWSLVGIAAEGGLWTATAVSPDGSPTDAVSDEPAGALIALAVRLLRQAA